MSRHNGAPVFIPVPDRPRMGRPSVHRGELMKTFRLTAMADELLDRLAEKEGCSRSDALVTALYEYLPAWKREIEERRRREGEA